MTDLRATTIAGENGAGETSGLDASPAYPFYGSLTGAWSRRGV